MNLTIISTNADGENLQLVGHRLATDTMELLGLLQDDRPLVVLGKSFFKTLRLSTSMHRLGASTIQDSQARRIILSEHQGLVSQIWRLSFVVNHHDIAEVGPYGVGLIDVSLNRHLNCSGGLH